MEEQVKKIYDKQRNIRIRGVKVCLITFLAMMGVFSIFLGCPLPYKKQVLFFEATQSGWIYSHWYLLIVCGVITLVVWIVDMTYGLLRQIKSLDRICLSQCDAKKYLELIKSMVDYGKERKWKGLEENLFLLMEQRYMMALIANEQFQEGKTYLKEKWVGDRTRGMYKRTEINLELAIKYANKETEEFCEIFEQAEKLFTKNRLFAAKRFLLGKCYEAVGNQEQAKTCMEYVKEHGNTMPQQVKAQEWLAFAVR